MSARLIRIALDNWLAVDGYAAAQGMRPLRKLTLDRFVAYVYWWATRNAQDEKDLAKFERQLWMPPTPDAPARGPWSPEAEMASLRGLKAGIGK